MMEPCKEKSLPGNGFVKMIHTGLYINTEKSKILLSTVKRMFRDRYNVEAISGPSQQNNTCEVLLRTLSSSGANLAQAKVFIEKYLTMVKETRSNFTLEKQTELIEIDDDDAGSTRSESPTVLDDSECLVVDMDSSDVETSLESTNIKWTQADKKALNSKNNEQEVDIVDLEDKKKKTSPVPELSRVFPADSSCGEVIVIEAADSPQSSVSCSSVSSLSRGSRKRKKSCEEEPELVEVDDDEVIVLDDSISTSGISLGDISELQITVANDSRTVILENSQCSTSSQAVNITADHKSAVGKFNEFKNKYIEQPQTSNPSKTSSDSNVLKVKPTNSGLETPPKKVSKFSYKGVAHLKTPLVKNVVSNSGSNPVQGKSSSGMSNIYNPNGDIQEKRQGLRPIIIDGNNIAISYGRLFENDKFSIKGLQLCINFFEKRGHKKIKAFIPQYQKRRSNHDIIELMEKQGTVVVTPSRYVNGRTIASYDDRYIVQYAHEVGGVIVTKDQFRDLLAEKPEWRETIEKRLLMPSWADEEMLMFPEDPLGKDGPKLDDFLSFPKE